MTATTTRWTGATWRAGDPPGDRRFADVGDVALERGGTLEGVTVAYETWGTLTPRGTTPCSSSTHSPGTATSSARRARAPHRGVVARPHRPRRPAGHRPLFVVAPNVLGGCQGTTGPSSAAPDGRPWGGRFPFVTIRDQVAVEAALADVLGISRVARRSSAARWAGCGPWSGPAPTPTGSGARCPRGHRRGHRRPDRLGPAAALAIRATPTTAGATTTTPGARRSPAWASPAGSRTPRTGTRPSSTSASAAARGPGRTRSAAAAATTSRATWTTTRPSSPAASTPAATSCSPRR